MGFYSRFVIFLFELMNINVLFLHLECSQNVSNKDIFFLQLAIAIGTLAQNIYINLINYGFKMVISFS
jgi:hypothetical protein